MAARKSYMERVTETMKRFPERIALRDERHPDGITYGELDALSGRIRGWLKERGIGREQTVLVHLPRGAECFVAAIGILRAGAAYVLAEAGGPEERTAFIEKDCGCVLRVDEAVYGQMTAAPPTDGYEPAGEHDAAVAVYTSGTTGSPKGVLLEAGHQALMVDSANDRGTPLVLPDDRMMLLSPMNFVASTYILLIATAAGAEVSIAGYATVRNASALLDYMKREKITAGFMTPSLVRAFMNGQTAADGRHPFNPEFRALFLSSEPAVHIWFRDLAVYNCYSQSEMGFLGGVYRVPRAMEATPVGRCMLPGFSLCLRDESGGMGEICVENPYFRGYIHLPEMTAHARRDGIYHTGDIGRVDENGDMVLLGRNDDMVKINGNRVEPEEIEAAAKKVLGVTWCAAKAFVKPERSYICVYYREETALDEETAIRKMAEKLPSYMVPACLMKISRIPLNANGKMDRKALPDPEDARRETAYAAPENGEEERICRAFARVLGLDRVSALDDFFRIGGDSLRTIRLVAEPEMEGISAADVFRKRTARALAATRLDKRDRRPETPEEQREREEKARRKAWPLTAVQQEFYDLQARRPESLMWVMPVLFAFAPEAEERVAAAARILAANHPVFATIPVKAADGRILQEYRPESVPPVRVEAGREEDIARIRALEDPDLPFRMPGYPLARVRVIRTEKQLYLYLLFHHVITDGAGIMAMLSTLRTVLGGGQPEPDGYYSWLEEETGAAGGPERAEARERMEALYAGCEWTGQIAPARPEPGEENSVTGTFLPMDEEEMRERERETGLSRTGLCAAALMLAIARHTGKRDILINWIYTNRGEPRLDRISGMLIKSLALGIRFERFATLGDVYREVKEQMLANITNLAYEWCPAHPREPADDRLFFVYEGRITDFDVLREAGGTLVPMTLKKNRAVAHPMSAQILQWAADGTPGFLLACYYNRNMFGAEETERFRSILEETAKTILLAPGSRDRTIGEMLGT